ERRHVGSSRDPMRRHRWRAGQFRRAEASHTPGARPSHPGVSALAYAYSQRTESRSIASCLPLSHRPKARGVRGWTFASYQRRRWAVGWVVVRVMSDRVSAWLDLFWLPLGAGGNFVRWNGRAYEWLVARRERRAPLDLY